jgi:hypothetical protein
MTQFEILSVAKRLIGETVGRGADCAFPASHLWSPAVSAIAEGACMSSGTRHLLKGRRQVGGEAMILTPR